MSTSDVRRLKSALKKHWPSKPGYKAERYVGQFFNATRFGTKIAAEVVGNHGTYTVSIQINQDRITSTCNGTVIFTS